MEKTVLYTVPSGFTALPIPTDMIELIDLVNSQGDRITKEDITTVNRLAGLTQDTRNVAALIDWPRYYYRQTNAWLLGPIPAVGDIVTVIYYAELAALINPTDTNVITVIAPDLIIYAALCYAGDFFTDRRLDRWEARYQQILTSLQTQSDSDELSGGATVSPAFFYPDPWDGGESFWNGWPAY